MRRERIILFIGALVAALAVAAPASAATPQEICDDLKDGQINGTYTAADWANFAKSASIQVYNCGTTATQNPPNPVVTVTPPASNEVTPTATVTPPPAGLLTPPVAEVKPTVQLPTVLPTATVPQTGVLGVDKTKTSNPANAAPANKNKTAAGVAPLAATKRSGSLPFTGLELGLFALVGGILIASGLALRFTARQQRSRA